MLAIVCVVGGTWCAPTYEQVIEAACRADWTNCDDWLEWEGLASRGSDTHGHEDKLDSLRSWGCSFRVHS